MTLLSFSKQSNTMKKILLLIIFLSGVFAYSQNNGINFQSVLVNENGVIETNTAVVLKFSFYYSNNLSTIIYSETHSSTTNAKGLLTAVVGSGTKVSNGEDLNALDWSQGITLKIERLISGNYQTLSTQILESVPYSFYASKAGAVNNLTIGSENLGIGESVLSNLVSGTLNLGIGYEALKDDTDGFSNTAIGYKSLKSNTTGNYNAGLGDNTLLANTTGSNNVAIGSKSMESNTTGINNTSVGGLSLMSNTEGIRNTGLGKLVLSNNTTGSQNVGIGESSLSNNITGNYNVAVGTSALDNNTTGNNNTAIGHDADIVSSTLTNATALGANAIVTQSNSLQLGDTNVTLVNTAGIVSSTGIFTSGTVTATKFIGDGSGLTNLSLTSATLSGTSINTLSDVKIFQGGNASSILVGNLDTVYTNTSSSIQGNTGFGVDALKSLTTGGENEAFGNGALQKNTSGYGNAAFGGGALYENTTGSMNTAIGGGALEFNTTGNYNVSIGRGSGETNETGSQNITIGWHSDVTSSTLVNAIAIGSSAKVTASNTIQLGSTSVTLVQTSGTVSATKFVGDGSGLINLNIDLNSSIVTGTGNLPVGTTFNSLANNAVYNTALGSLALDNISSGGYNTAIGREALSNVSTGNYNTAIGARALQGNSSSKNIAIGADALYTNSSGESNVAIGVNAQVASTGSKNISVGTGSLFANISGNNNIAIGDVAGDTNITGSNNILLGYMADVSSSTLSNAIAIGANTVVNASNTIQLGDSNITLVETSGTVSASAFVGDGSGLTGISGTTFTNEILINPHDVTTNTSVLYPPGYYINLIPFPEGTGTQMGGVMIPLIMPSNWDTGTVTVTFYYSCSAADGDIYFNTGARKYGTGDTNITSPVAGFDLTPSAAWTLYKYTYTQSVGDFSSNSSDDSILIINFSRYGYQPSTYGDTNTGDMYIHGIRIGYSTN